MFCPKCGNEIKEATKFCPKCGKELVNQQGSAQQNSNQAQNLQQTKNVTKHTMKTISSKNMEQTTTSDFGEDLVSGNIKERHFAKFYALVKREKCKFCRKENGYARISDHTSCICCRLSNRVISGSYK